MHGCVVDSVVCVLHVNSRQGMVPFHVCLCSLFGAPFFELLGCNCSPPPPMQMVEIMC